VKSSSSGDIEPSVRLEQGFGQGSQIGVFYDPMIAKLVVHGRDRTEALRVLRKALDEYKVVGVSTNVEFLRTLAENEAFIQGDVETGFIPVNIYSALGCSLAHLFDLFRNTSMSCSRRSPHRRRKRLHRPLSTLSFETTPSLLRLPHPGPLSVLADSAETFMIAWSPYKPRMRPRLIPSESGPLLPVSSISL
jgi:acetyl/propionyl-CoA carboxylase alpha subunit